MNLGLLNMLNMFHQWDGGKCCEEDDQRLDDDKVWNLGSEKPDPKKDASWFSQQAR